MIGLRFPRSILDTRRPSDAKARAKKQIRRSGEVLTLFDEDEEPQLTLTPESPEAVWVTSARPTPRPCVFTASLFCALHELQNMNERDQFYSNVEALASHPSGVLALLEQTAQTTLAGGFVQDKYESQRSRIRLTILATLIDNWAHYVALGPRFGFTGITLGCLWRSKTTLMPMMFAMGGTLTASTWWEWLDADGFRWVMERAARGTLTTDEDVFAYQGHQRPNLSGTCGILITATNSCASDAQDA